MKCKRWFAALLCAVMMLTLCVGCGEKPAEPQTPPADETATAWDGDLKEHWHVGADGAATDKAAHTLDEGGICSVCNANVVDFGDGSGAITVVNEYGDTVIYRTYAVDGTVEWESKSDITYDEQGRRASETVYNDGRLQQEITYQYGPDGDELFALNETYYNDDGTKEVSEYDEVGELIRTLYYDAAGVKTKEETYEYEYTEDGQIKGKKIFANGTLAVEETYTPDADGFYCLSEEISYNEDGTVKGIKKYDADGNVIE